MKRLFTEASVADSSGYSDRPIKSMKEFHDWLQTTHSLSGQAEFEWLRKAQVALTAPGDRRANLIPLLKHWNGRTDKCRKVADMESDLQHIIFGQ